VVDGAPTAEPSEESTRSEDLPDRLRVHSLARTLGTTSKRVLDALSALDGRIRSAHSTVDREDAVRVRDLLAAQPQESPENAGVSEDTDADEPESRLMLETPDNAAERPHYMPLFVAPQPLDGEDESGTAEGADSDDSDSDDDDDEQADRPSNRRRRQVGGARPRCVRSPTPRVRSSSGWTSSTGSSTCPASTTSCASQAKTATALNAPTRSRHHRRTR